MSVKRVFAACFLIAMFSVSAAAAEKELAQPPVISVPTDTAPSDAIVLFDGSSLREWQSLDGGEAKWKISRNTMMNTNGSGGIITKRDFGDVQIHLEFATPEVVEGEGQARGNSGVYVQGAYEVQVLDSYENETYADGMLGAVYEQYVPLVNAARKPGEWQTYDIIFRAPVINGSGHVVKRPTFTVLLNGVLVQDNVEINGPTRAAPRPDISGKGPIYLQDHGNPVKYRNIWVREL